VLVARIGALVLAAATLGGCAALVVGGAVGTAVMVTDRRTAGTQLEDQNIELKSVTSIRETVGERGHINVTSYNRQVLLTGEVASEADRAAIEQAIGRIEGVKTIVNELAAMAASTMTTRSNDTILTSRVKASYLDAKDLQANAVKVVTERAVVYLMGRVTEREANRATDLARGVAGVQKVVKIFETLTEAELAALSSNPKP
jgi:osmotically-inducible protein OsmY